MSTRRRRLLIDRHALTNADRGAVARLCIALFNAASHNPREEEQLLALAAAFLIMAESLDVSPQDAFTAIKNMMVDPMRASGIFHQFDAARHYLDNELGAGFRRYA